MGVAGDWRLSKAHDCAGGTVAYEVLGDGSPVVLVHGTPSWSYLWRKVASELLRRHGFYYDLYNIQFSGSAGLVIPRHG